MEQRKIFYLTEDSDDEELPDLFNSDYEANSEIKNEISKGDIVWAEFRKLYWPSLVRFIYKKDKKVSIWYLDSPKKTFKVPLNKIKPFSDPKVNTVIRDEVKSSPMKALHTKVWLNALTYIRRQAEGHNDDPGAYFDLNEHYFASKDSKMHDARCTVPSVEDPFSTETIAEETDEESLIGSEDEEGAGLEKKISIFWDLDDSLEDETKTTAIVECITSGKVDKHLLRIKNRKIQSEYQEIFNEAMKTDRKKLFGITACDVIKNLKKLKDISFYLMNLYEKTVEGGKCEMLDYVTSVWLPEAINQAVILIDGRVSPEVAPKIKRVLFSSAVCVENGNSDITSQSNTINENKIENETQSNAIKENKIEIKTQSNIINENKIENKNKSNIIEENKIESESNGKRVLRTRLPRSEHFYCESKSVSPAKKPRKKHKKRK